jgi:diguanylate cyclase (GGDEF)-like protein
MENQAPKSMTAMSSNQTISGTIDPSAREVPPRASRAAESLPLEGAADGKPRVLIVDDVAAILDMFREFFAEAEFELVLASNGAEGIEEIQKKPFTVVVTDLRMHPVSGLEVVKFTKENYPETEVIVLTGYASVESTIDAIHYHVFDYVEKPVNLEKFSRIVVNALEKARLSRENKRLLQMLHEQNVRLEHRVREVTRELRELSSRDALTGLHNYRYFSNTLMAEVSRALRYGRSLSLAMLDLDHFKKYNDTHGHQVGNEALVQVGHTLHEQTRENDICVRYGGEEFAILFPETTKAAAAVTVERIRNVIRGLGMEYENADGSKGTLTVSAGIACCPVDARTDQTLIEKADAALYRAKSEGRDRLCLS